MNEETPSRRSTAVFKYLIANDADRTIGAVVDAVGSQEIAPNDRYPLRVHPSDYFFDTEKGRVLHEYQLLYITQGKGSFRTFAGSSAQEVPVNKGTIILLRPGELHSYYPLRTTGWAEYYIGFEGETFDRLIRQMGFDKGTQLWEIGLNNELTQLYARALEIASENKTGAQGLLTGIVWHLLGLVGYLIRNSSGQEPSLLEQAVERAKIIMDEKINEEIDLSVLASQLNLSYSWFRKTFKEYTGLSPARYFQQLKLRRAQRLLSDTSCPVKEIAYSLGYKSTEHFFSIFKKHTGYTPTAYRNYGRK